MFEPVKQQARRHRQAIRDAYKEGYQAENSKSNPYSAQTQSARYHAFNAGRYDKQHGFSYEDLE